MLNYRNDNLWRAFVDFLFDIVMKKWLLKYIPISRLECKNHILFMTKNGRNQLKLIPYLWPKQLKTIPFGAAHTYIAHITEYCPGGGGGNQGFNSLIFFRHPLSSCLNWKINCNDHSSLSITTAVQIWIISYNYTSHYKHCRADVKP